MARRGDYSKPKLNARQRYQAKVNYNRQVAQLEGLYQQGMSVEEVRALRDTWGQGSSQYTVADGDTLPDIAKANNTTEADILAANPDASRIQTGMVLNVLGGDRVGTIPSNAAQGAVGGGLSTYNVLGGDMTGKTLYNVLGGNMTGRTYQPPNFFQNLVGYDPNKPLANKTTYPAWESFSGGISSAFRKLVGLDPFTSTNGSTNPLGQTIGASATTAHPSAGTPATTAPRLPNQNFGTPRITPQRSHQTESRWVEEIYTKMLPVSEGGQGYIPTQGEMNYLRATGRVVPSTMGSGGGGGGGFGSGGSRSRGRGGGGGGGGGGVRGAVRGAAPDYANARQERLPAFGSGAGFRGLVNWRI